MCVYLFAHTYMFPIYMYRVYIYMYVYMCIYRCMCGCICIFTCIYIYIYACIYVYVYTYTCMYMYTYMYMYIHIYICLLSILKHSHKCTLLMAMLQAGASMSCMDQDLERGLATAASIRRLLSCLAGHLRSWGRAHVEPTISQRQLADRFQKRGGDVCVYIYIYI